MGRGIANRITYNEAIEMLPEGDFIHTYLRGIGADWKRENVLEFMKDNSENIGKVKDEVLSFGHRLVIWDGKKSWFIATKE